MPTIKTAEVHAINGTKQRGKVKKALLPDAIKKRIPHAEWLDNPEKWDKGRFIDETAQFLWDAYGIGNEQDKHALAMLAIQMDVMVKCMLMMDEVIVDKNGGGNVGLNPYIMAFNTANKMAIIMMTELGLTPKGRLSSGKEEGAGEFNKFLKGPLG